MASTCLGKISFLQQTLSGHINHLHALAPHSVAVGQHKMNSVVLVSKHFSCITLVGLFTF